MSVKFGLLPIAAPNARLFILGSLPGDASLAAERYYAHPTNQFWRLLGSALGEDLQALGNEQRLGRLAARGVGLWDVIASASRRGSLDQSIRDAEHNQLERLIADFPELRALAFNGKTSARIGRQLIGDSHFELIDLPSSSAANTVAFAVKAEAWSRLAQFALPAQRTG